jgi:hypothetical protein
MPNNKKEIIKKMLLAAKQFSDTLDVSQMDRLLTGFCANRAEHDALFKNLGLYFTRHRTPESDSFRLNATGQKYIEAIAVRFASISKIISAKMEQLQQKGHLASWEAHLTTVHADCSNGHLLYMTIHEIENYYYIQVKCPVLADNDNVPFVWNDTFIAADRLEKSTFLEDLIQLYATDTSAKALTL